MVGSGSLEGCKLAGQILVLCAGPGHSHQWSFCAPFRNQDLQTHNPLKNRCPAFFVKLTSFANFSPGNWSHAGPCARRLAPDREQQRRIAVVGVQVDRAELALLDRTTDVLASRARPASPLLHSCHTVHRQSTCSSMRDFQTSNRRMILHHELLQSPRCGGGPAPRGWPPPPTMDRRGAFFIYCGDPEIFLPQNPEGIGRPVPPLPVRSRTIFPLGLISSAVSCAGGPTRERLQARCH